MHSTSASRVSRLIEKPNAYSAMKAATRHTGTVTAGISAAAQAAEEQPDHQEYQHHRLAQGPVHALDGRLDELGVVGGNEDLGAFGQALLDFLRLGTCRAGDVQRVGGRCAHDPQANIGDRVAACIGTPFARTYLACVTSPIRTM